eukprot:2279666-Prymnesium_polylepis.1
MRALGAPIGNDFSEHDWWMGKYDKSQVRKPESPDGPASAPQAIHPRTQHATTVDILWNVPVLALHDGPALIHNQTHGGRRETDPVGPRAPHGRHMVRCTAR